MMVTVTIANKTVTPPTNPASHSTLTTRYQKCLKNTSHTYYGTTDRKKMKFMITRPQTIKFVTREGEFVTEVTLKNGLVTDRTLIPIPEIMIPNWNSEPYFAGDILIHTYRTVRGDDVTEKKELIFLKNAVETITDETTAAIDRIGNAFENINLVTKPVISSDTVLLFDQKNQQYILNWMRQLGHQPAKREYGKILNILLYGNK